MRRDVEMKDKHIKGYIEQCLANARLSPCSRRKFGALAVDPVHNVVITSGYNGTPRGSRNDLCGGIFCLRDGIQKEGAHHGPADVRVHDLGQRGLAVVLHNERGAQTLLHKQYDDSEELGRSLWNQAADRYPPIASGTRYEVGCHHAEANVVTNAARLGRSLAGSWVFCSGVPCLGCARLLHHAGVVKVLAIRGGFSGESGAPYLREHGVDVVEVDPPFDLRAAVEKTLAKLNESVLKGEPDDDVVDQAVTDLTHALNNAPPSTGPVIDPGREVTTKVVAPASPPKSPPAAGPPDGPVVIDYTDQVEAGPVAVVVTRDGPVVCQTREDLFKVLPHAALVDMHGPSPSPKEVIEAIQQLRDRKR